MRRNSPTPWTSRQGLTSSFGITGAVRISVQEGPQTVEQRAVVAEAIEVCERERIAQEQLQRCNRDRLSRALHGR